MSKNVKIDFIKREAVLNLSKDWFDLGGGLYAAKVGKEASKKFFTSKRAAGREYFVIDTKARVITAKDTLVDLSGFNKAEKNVILAASTYESTVKDVLSLGLAWYVVASGKAWAKLDKPRAGKEYAVLTYKTGTTAGRWICFDSEPLETGLKPIKQTTAQIVHLMETPRPAVSSALFDKCYKKAAALPEDKQRELYEDFDKRSKDTTSKFFSEVNDFIRARQDYISSDKEAAAFMLAWYDLQPAKDTGFTSITLDRKELEQAPATATKKKVVKELTAPAATKRPKSKSRARLEASRAAIKTLDKTAADFTAFCKQINKGRKVPYSVRNCALLYDQSNGAATEVKGFQGWKQAGRVVKKGSQALVIEAPKMIKGVDKDGKEYEHLICTPVCVFDISQTEALAEKRA